MSSFVVSSTSAVARGAPIVTPARRAQAPAVRQAVVVRGAFKDVGPTEEQKKAMEEAMKNPEVRQNPAYPQGRRDVLSRPLRARPLTR